MAGKKDMLKIEWSPDRQSKTPLYQQIVDYFSKQIHLGNWCDGQVLPSQRELAKKFKVNRSTIIQAMDELSAYGIIESDFGGGTRIVTNGWLSIIKEKKLKWEDYINKGYSHANLPSVQAINRLEFENGIVRMCTGELSPELGQAGRIKEAMEYVSRQKLYTNYPDPLGLLDLREEVQKHLRKFGIEVPLSCILIVSGALQALQTISLGIVPKALTIFTESPSYLNSLNIFQSVGAHLKGVSMDKDGLQPWKMHIQPANIGKSMLYINPTFQNPTGSVMPILRRREVLNTCQAQHIPIIEDDVFREMWIDEPPAPPLKAIDKSGSICYIGSVSKSFSGGMRLGWLVAPEPVVQRLADVKMQMDYGVGVLTQQVMAELFRRGLYQEGIDAIRPMLRSRRDLMLSLLEEYFSDLATWNRPSGGFFIWLKLNHGISTERLFYPALKKKLLILPGNAYDTNCSSCLRLTYGYLSEDEMAYGIRELAGIVRTISHME